MILKQALDLNNASAAVFVRILQLRRCSVYVWTISSNGRSNYLLYADNTTMFRHTKVVDLQNTLDEMQHEMNEVNTWSNEKNLCLNAKRTKVILFSTSQMSRRQNFKTQWSGCLTRNNQWNKSLKSRFLGWLSINTWPGECHVNATTQSCYSILKSLRIFRRSVDFKLRRSLAQSLILSRINYCNAILSDAPQYLLNKLQKIQNAAAAVLFMVDKWMKMM